MFATKKHIAGSEGTHNYVVIRQTSLGLVAGRHLNAGASRCTTTTLVEKAFALSTNS